MLRATEQQGRRRFFKMLTAFGAGVRLHSLEKVLPGQFPRLPEVPPQAAARDNSLWDKVAAQYDVDRGVTNLENAYWDIMARSVQETYLEKIKFVNRFNVVYVRDAYQAASFSKDLEGVRQTVAHTLGSAANEIALTRSGTEALQNLIVNYRVLLPGDAVIYADLDFDAMQFAMDFLVERRGVKVVRIDIPEPASRANILASYERVLRNISRPKLLLLTHISHRTGLLLPVAEITRLARSFGVDVIVDAAQSWGQVDFKVSDLGADFVGFSLHKWMGAPLGTGCLYVKAGRLPDIDPHFKNRDWPGHDIRSRVLTGTSNFASQLTVPDALSFHTHVGAPRKEARLRHLRDYWVERVREIKDLEILTPDDPALHCGLTSFRFKGKGSTSDVLSLQKTLVGKYRILTAARKGIARGDAIRVTPALYTAEADLDRLVAALREISAKG